MAAARASKVSRIPKTPVAKDRFAVDASQALTRYFRRQSRLSPAGKKEIKLDDLVSDSTMDGRYYGVFYCCFHQESQSKESTFFLELGSDLAEAILVRSLGGRQVLGKKADPFTEIEMKVLEEFSKALTDPLESAWLGPLGLKPRFGRGEWQLQMMREIPSNSLCHRMEFELDLEGELLGQLFLVVPSDLAHLSK